MVFPPSGRTSIGKLQRQRQLYRIKDASRQLQSMSCPGAANIFLQFVFTPGRIGANKLLRIQTALQASRYLCHLVLEPT